ncbi:unnamed protein product [Phytomonas sp. Hart1]|nr:unnamed protein product [Phytomonas sp. Hart1]|eukprot:CCW68975.1 unnamed protein product [Phytomonas sp. isolate Hart1]
MLKEWLKGTPAEAEKTEAPKKSGRMVLDAEKTFEAEDSPQKSRELFEKKLSDSAKEGPPMAHKVVTYDNLFQKAQGILLEANNNEVQEGLNLNVSRNLQNTLIASKWCLVNPQMSHWEINFQMNGFSDIIAASWNTLNRYQLMYQRVSSRGAMLVSQFMAQKQQGLCQGTVFAMLQYPWVSGGCSQLQYIKDQSFTMSHIQRIIRGFYLGSSLSIDPNTHSSVLSHAASFTTPKKNTSFIAEWTPSKGTWKLAATSFDWGQNMDAAIELDYKEGREGTNTHFNIGCRKNFLTGSKLVASLKGFNKLKINLELPFGGEVRGANQFNLMFNCQYDIHSGAVKQGLVFTA